MVCHKRCLSNASLSINVLPVFGAFAHRVYIDRSVPIVTLQPLKLLFTFDICDRKMEFFEC